MKKISLYAILGSLLIACGGGSDNSSTSLGRNQTVYGFSAEGAPFVATLNLQNNSYEYSSIDTTNGNTSSTVKLRVDALPNDTAVFKIYDHGDHFLAVDSSQNTLLASTRSSNSAKAEPTLFALKPLVNFSDIAGSYYFKNLGPFWYRLNVSAAGSVSVDCKSFSLTEDFGGIEISDDLCSASDIISNVRLRAMHPPYWKLDFQVKSSDIVRSPTLTYTSTLLFAKNSTGRVAYSGENTQEFCYSDGSCNSSQGETNILQESQNFNTSVTYGGTWLFNRQGGDSSQLSLNTAGTGTIASGLTARGSFSNGITNIDPTRNTFNLLSFSTTVTSIVDAVTTTNNATVEELYGISRLRNLGGNTAVELSLINQGALFKRVSPVETKTFTLLSRGVSGPYTITLSPDESARLVDIDVFIQTFDISGSTLLRSTRLDKNVDYEFAPLSGQIFLRSFLPSVGEGGEQIRLSVKAYLTPVGIKTNPVAWGVRIR